jgi:serine/threonine protein kinase
MVVFKKINFDINCHPNLIKIYDMYLTSKHLYIVMELCGKDQDLKEYITRRYSKKEQGGKAGSLAGVPISEQEAMLIIDNCLQGLLWLNKYNILHRDIK